jgi:hypothetical protein
MNTAAEMQMIRAREFAALMNTERTTGRVGEPVPCRIALTRQACPDYKGGQSRLEEPQYLPSRLSIARSIHYVEVHFIAA